MTQVKRPAESADGATTPSALTVPVLPVGLATPCLVVDLEIVERNIERLATAARDRGVAIRPHIKTHKSVALARMQVDAGATGITVGTVGEAEVMAEGGLDDIFIAYPVWADGARAARIAGLHEAVALSVGIDSAEGAERLARAVDGATRRLAVLIEIDSGARRSGLARPADVVRVAGAARSAGLTIAGIFTHGGHSYLGPEAGVPAAADEVATLGAAADALREAGHSIGRISAGSTPTAVFAAAGQVNEIRPGTYLLGDRQQLVLGAIPPDGLALVVAATVVSTAVPGQVVLDAGAKTLTKDRASFLDGYGLMPAYTDAVIERLFDYHGAVAIPAGTPAPALGDIVAIVPNHVCPVVAQFDTFIATRAGVVIGEWPVDARGRSG
jgi:D-serine deaminase-like pyridoxal phosphate-dependent protein